MIYKSKKIKEIRWTTVAKLWNKKLLKERQGWKYERARPLQKQNMLYPYIPEQCNNFSDCIKYYMKNKKLNQKELITRSRLSRTTISRIVRNSNDKGDTYTPTLYVVAAISFGLKLTCAELKELYYYAYPEMKIWEQCLAEGKDIYDTNAILYEKGLHLLGNIEE